MGIGFQTKIKKKKQFLSVSNSLPLHLLTWGGPDWTFACCVDIFNINKMSNNCLLSLILNLVERKVNYSRLPFLLVFMPIWGDPWLGPSHIKGRLFLLFSGTLHDSKSHHTSIYLTFVYFIFPLFFQLANARLGNHFPFLLFISN